MALISLSPVLAIYRLVEVFELERFYDFIEKVIGLCGIVSLKAYRYESCQFPSSETKKLGEQFFRISLE